MYAQRGQRTEALAAANRYLEGETEPQRREALQKALGQQ